MKSSVALWVDGSFMQSGWTGGWGFVAVKDGEVVLEKCAKIECRKLLKHRNISGEVLAVVHAIEWAIQAGHFDFTLYYDYAGLGHWALGKWQAKNDLTKTYQKWIQNKVQSLGLNINWVQVKGHSNLEHNDLADGLAKTGATMGEVVQHFP